MIPFIRSLNELMAITQSREQLYKIYDKKIIKNMKEKSMKSKRYIHSENKKKVELPNLPNLTRHKWIRSKKALSRFFDELDYNNQIQSSYDLTLLDRGYHYDEKEVA
tara:strand:- start:523 stop:843 length:321 start_codon:yes stop_codon:yes gene_type:complete